MRWCWWMLLMNWHTTGCGISYRLRWRMLTGSTIMWLLMHLRWWYCCVLRRKLSTGNDWASWISRGCCSGSSRLKNLDLQVVNKNSALETYLILEKYLSTVGSSYLNAYRLWRLIRSLLWLLRISHQVVTNLRSIRWMNVRTLNPHFYAYQKYHIWYKFPKQSINLLHTQYQVLFSYKYTWLLRLL